MSSARPDRFIGLFPSDGVPTLAYGVVKRAYTWDGRVTEAEAPPLSGKPESGNDDTEWAPGSDFHLFKAFTDVIVLGSAYPESPQPCHTREVSVSFGTVTKRLRVFGERVLRGRGEQGRIVHVAPIERVPLTRAEAFGGAALPDQAMRVSPVLRHLGPRARSGAAYPRNPYGRGYVGPGTDAPDDLALPRVEDPEDLLTAERLASQATSPWTSLPLPWHLDWTSLDHFPRLPEALPAGLAPEELAEHRRALWPREWFGAAGVEQWAKDAAMWQDASLGMLWRAPEPGAPVRLVGMHPSEDTMQFALPGPPRMEIEIEGSRALVEPRLTNLVITPDEKTFTMTWAAVRRDLPRKFIPGIHGYIPLKLYVDGEAPIEYQTPTPIYQLVKQAEREAGVRPKPGTKGFVEISGGLFGAEPPVRDRDQSTQVELVGEMDALTGRLLLSETDWSLEGASFPFAFTRSYASSRSWRSGPLGPGWCHPLEQAVWVEGAQLLYRTDDGRELTIAHLSSGELGLGQRVHHGTVSVARVAGDAYDLIRADGWRLAFTVMPQLVQEGPSEARLTGMTSPLGVTAKLGYDSAGRLARMALPSRHELRFEHDARGRLVAVYVPTADGAQHAVGARYEHDGAGQLVSATDGAGNTTRYKYQSRLLTQRDRGQKVTRYRYDGDTAHARVVGSDRVGGGAARVLSFNAKEGTVVVHDAVENARVLRLGPNHRPTALRDAFGREVQLEYDEVSGLCVARTDSIGGRTEYLYDAAYHLADVTYPDGGSDALEHDAAGRLVGWKNADGHEARWGWDHLGRLGAAIDRNGASILYEYEDEGALKGVLAPGEARLWLIRDPRSSAIVEVRSAMGSRRASHDALSRIVEVKGEDGGTWRFRYDPCGRASQVELPTGLLRAFESDADGRVTSVRDGVVALRFERDPFGRLSHIDEGEGGPSVHRDAEGRVTMVESEAGDFWELHRDAAGRVKEEAGFLDQEVHTFRDHAGRISREMRGEARSNVTRDAMGRPINVEHDDESFQRFKWSKAGWLTQAQDADRVLSIERDGEGRVTLEKQGAHWVRSEYDASGRRVVLSSSLGLRAAVERDVLGGALRVTAQRGKHRLELRFTRDACGRESKRSLGQGLEARWKRDALGRPIERALFAGDARLAIIGWAWAGADRLVRTFEVRGTREHHHDKRGRLVGAGSQIRALDEAGNVYRTWERDDHRYAPGGRLLEAYGVEYGYDREGRRVEKKTLIGDPVRYRWDSLGRLTEVALSPTTRVVYDYDALGRRTARRHEQQVEVPGLDEPVWEARRETHFVWDGLTLLHEIEGESVTTWLWEEGVLIGKLCSAGAFAALTDPVGMPTELVDSAGKLAWRGNVDAFGVLQRDIEATDCPWRFPGHWEDPETGLAHALFRVYDPETGAYATPSPLGVAGGPNLYTYLPDPFSQSSPLGLSRGYAALAGAFASERLCAELAGLAIRALDRGDGAAGPRACFDRAAAEPRLPDPEACLWGPWEGLRPARRMPPPTSTFTRLPASTGLVDHD